MVKLRSLNAYWAAAMAAVRPQTVLPQITTSAWASQPSSPAAAAAAAAAAASTNALNMSV